MSEMNGTTPPTDVRQTAIVLGLEFHVMGNSKAVPSSAVHTDADPTALHISKQLLDSPELRELKHLRSDARAYIEDIAMPSMLKSGLWLIAVRRVEQVDERLQGYALLWRGQVETVIQAYPDRCQEAEARLASLYHAEDYLDTTHEGWQEIIREACQFAWQWLELSTPTRLQGINKALWDAEKEKAEEMWASVTDSARLILREQFAAFVRGLHERLTGEKKNLQQRYLDRLTAWTEAFREGRDLTDDTALQALVTQADNLLRGRNVTDLKGDAGTTYVVATELASMQETLLNMVGEKPTRRYLHTPAPAGVATL